MNNADIAAALRETAELLELENESTFRIRAYENASNTIGGLTEDVRTIAAEGRLKKVKGIGPGIASKIEELLETGSIEYLENLRRDFPPGVRSLMAVPGVGPSLARRVYRELGIDSLDELRAAAGDGRLAELSGLGPKSAENVLRALDRVSKEEHRILIGQARPVAEEIVDALRPLAPVGHLVPGGSLRRWAPTIGDIDLIATSGEPARVMDTFVSLPIVTQVLGHGPTKSTIITDSGLQVDLRIVEEECFGSLLQHFTGSRDHNIELREYALHRGLSLNEYGITQVATGRLQSFADEQGFYAALDLDWIPPELRQGTGEIAAAETHELPDPITVDDIRGDLHVHSNWSDGQVPIEEMVAAAVGRGYEYVAITDHSHGIGVANGLTPERLEAQLIEIEEARQKFPGIRILSGTELEIKRDGSLDFPEEILNRLDWVIASIHSGFNQSQEQITQRIIRAMESPYVDAIAHPTGRLIGRREPYAVDLEAIFTAAARTRTALEINSSPERLDLVDAHARRAKDLGVLLVVDTDAHAPGHFDNMRYGVAMARRGWATARDVLNTRATQDLEAWLRRDAQSP